MGAYVSGIAIYCNHLDPDEPTDWRKRCHAHLDIAAATIPEARARAKKQGWTVNVRTMGEPRNLGRDFCPDHRPESGDTQ